jgi:hypothetical protein
MKNFLLMFALVCIVITTQAQFTTGQKMIGGQISGGFSTGKVDGSSDYDKRANAAFTLSLSKFKSPTEYRSVGITYAYTHHSAANMPSLPDEIRENAHAFNIFFDRTKLVPLASRFYFTYTGSVGAGVQFSRSTTKHSPTTIYNDDYNNYQAFLTGNIGLLYQLTPRFLFTCNLANLLSVNFLHSDSRNSIGPGPYNYHNNSISLSTGLSGLGLNSISIGAKYMLKK